MILKKINISQFRNYKKLELELNKGINIIYGNNAQGKTNLLESIYVLGITKSHRSFIDNNLIKSGEKACKISGTIINDNIPINLEIQINQKHKKIKIDNDEIKKISDYISLMNIIIFYPEDLEIIKGSPSIRRRYINLELSQLNSNYLNIYSDFNKILKIRNDYLKKIKNGMTIDYSYFDILNNYFIEKAILIYEMRNKFINDLNTNISDIFKNLSDISNFSLKYKSSVVIDENIKDNLSKKINKLKETEIKLGMSLVGPHRDDLEFYIDEQNLKNYGSQGQQRLAILALKLSEIQIFKKYKNTNPILLLDDVFSELDNIKKNNLLAYINNDIQTIITTTDLKNIDEMLLKNSKLINIENGNIIKIKEEK